MVYYSLQSDNTNLSSKVASYAVAAPYTYALPYAVAALKTGCINSVGSVVPCAV